MKIKLPENVLKIIDIIEKSGYEAFAVGGCIRDSILGRNPNDWDITTSAKPEIIKKIFKKTIDTGIEHGTVTVLMNGLGYEITTYRIDGEYEDNRHPKEVSFTSNLIEDLKRRDFTINAMAYNQTQGLVDAFDGIRDLEKGIIRCVGNPEERFMEDALRIMRAVRFSAQLGYEIEENTKEAIKKLRYNLTNISVERIQVELVKLLISDHPDYIKIAYELGITEVILNEIDDIMNTEQNHPHHIYSVGEHTIKALSHVPNQKIARLAILFHDLGKVETLTIDQDGITHFYGHEKVSAELAKNILKRLKFDNETICRVYKIVYYHDYGNSIVPTFKIVRKAANKIGIDIMEDLFMIKEADIKAQSNYMRKEKEENLNQWKEIYKQILKENQCINIKDLAVDGKDLIQLGIKPGKEIGEILNYLLELVLEDHEKNDKNYLISQIKNRK